MVGTRWSDHPHIIRRSRRSPAGADRRTGRATSRCPPTTRAMIDPTVRHPMRINSMTDTLGRLGGRPGHRLIEGERVTRAVPGPRHLRHDHAVLAAEHPRRVGLQHHLHRAQIQRPPTAPLPHRCRTSRSDAGRPRTGRPLPGLAVPARPAPGRVRRTRRPPRPSSPHPTRHAIPWRRARRSPFMCSGPSTSPEPTRERRVALNGPRPHPRMGQKSRNPSAFSVTATSAGATTLNSELLRPAPHIGVGNVYWVHPCV
jgi:hypothetical protein